MHIPASALDVRVMCQRPRTETKPRNVDEFGTVLDRSETSTG